MTMVLHPEVLNAQQSRTFIGWLFNNRCIMCKKSASEINEIIPRARTRYAVTDWKNRVPLCRSCHEKYHKNGVTFNKIAEMITKRKAFLTSTHREQFI